MRVLPSGNEVAEKLYCTWADLLPSSTGRDVNCVEVQIICVGFRWSLIIRLMFGVSLVWSDGGYIAGARFVLLFESIIFNF